MPTPAVSPTPLNCHWKIRFFEIAPDSADVTPERIFKQIDALSEEHPLASGLLTGGYGIALALSIVILIAAFHAGDDIITVFNGMALYVVVLFLQAR